MRPRSPDHRAFGSAIRELRQERNLSQEDLAYQSGLDRSYMGAVERGEQNVALTNILKVTAALGIDTTELFSRFEKVRQRSA